MPNHLSILGIVHTGISVLALLFAFYILITEGKIDPEEEPSKFYIALTVFTCFTGLPIMKTDHLTAGHYLAVIILAILPIAIYARAIPFFGKFKEHIQTFVMSLTVFFSMIPAIVETTTRLPISHPLAADSNSPIVLGTLLVLTLLFIVGVVYQLRKISIRQKAAQSPDNSITLS